jgi:branched-chain amino acid aminotransferase
LLSSTEARVKGFDEALLMDVNGFVAEGPGANFFFEKDGVLYTPPRGNILPGITRQTIIELADYLGIEIKEVAFTPQDVHGADSAFFTGTAAEVSPISSVDGHAFKLNWEDSLGYVLQRRYQLKVTRKDEEALALL